MKDRILDPIKEKLEARFVDRPLLVTVKDFEEFNASIPKFPIKHKISE
jgi:hypothetical protein